MVLLSSTLTWFSYLQHQHGVIIFNINIVPFSSTSKWFYYLQHQHVFIVFNINVVLISSTSKWFCYLPHRHGLIIFNINIFFVGIIRSNNRVISSWIHKQHTIRRHSKGFIFIFYNDHLYCAC